MSVRTRFAPSPTGFLHIGGARTALYSWLYARKNNGVFILRIEDTDLERSTQEAVDAIIEGMNWLGLDYDEGPYFQMQRVGRYREILQKMLDEGTAYRCYCSKERLEKLREDQMARKEKPRYDGHCRNLTAVLDQPYVIRFKNPQEGEVSFNDKVRGVVIFKNSELDDLIIARTDGTPTYNFTVVIDDWDMHITHVIRGDDHVNNTPRQINILKALGAELPVYAHVPMILGSDGKRLSKRHGAVSVTQYREEGFLPEALLNYLVRLGWSAGDQEIFSREEMILLFDLDNLNKSPAAFNFEKLVWLNQHYFKTCDLDYLVKNFQPHLDRLNVNTSSGPTLSEVVMAQRERCKTFIEMAEKSRFFYEDTVIYDAADIDKYFTADLIPVFQDFLSQLQNVSDWQRAHLNQIVHEVAEKFAVKLGKIAQPLRIAITGGTISPSIDVTLELLGKAKVLARLEQAIKLMEKK